MGHGAVFAIPRLRNRDSEHTITIRFKEYVWLFCDFLPMIA